MVIQDPFPPLPIRQMCRVFRGRAREVRVHCDTTVKWTRIVQNGGFWTNRVHNPRLKSWDQGQDKAGGDPVVLIVQRPLVLLMALLRG